MMSKNFQQEAEQYDLLSLINLQNKRESNILLFTQSIKNERLASQQEEVVESSLESKLHLHHLGIKRLDETEYHLISLDLPKIKSTRQKRDETIELLKKAIIEEQEMKDNEQIMIRYLENKNGNTR